MKIEVRYLSKSGNTAKVANAIAAAVGTVAKSISEPVAADTELLFIGGAVYAFGVDDGLRRFIAAMPNSIKRAAIFSTSAVVKSAFPQIKKLLEERGIAVCENEFHCRGAFKFMHKGRPDSNDLNNAKDFAKEVVKSGI
jgi:flavodoxin